jgi:hypothetical protein
MWSKFHNTSFLSIQKLKNKSKFQSQKLKIKSKIKFTLKFIFRFGLVWDVLSRHLVEGRRVANRQFWQTVILRERQHSPAFHQMSRQDILWHIQNQTWIWKKWIWFLIWFLTFDFEILICFLTFEFVFHFTSEKIFKIFLISLMVWFLKILIFLKIFSIKYMWAKYRAIGASACEPKFNNFTPVQLSWFNHLLKKLRF